MADEAVRKIVGPFNRVEGDLEITLDVVDGAVEAAFVNSPLFRGFEIILEGKDPRDALTITPRICGICSISQSVAAARALGDLQGIAPTPQGEVATALIHGVENIVDHLTHFYLFFMPDFSRPDYQGAPFFETCLERFGVGSIGQKSWLAARAEILHVMGILAGKWPHTLAIQPGGVTRAPDARARVQLIGLARRLRAWVEENLFGGSVEAFAELSGRDDLLAWSGGDARLFLEAASHAGLFDVGSSVKRYMSFGGYEVGGATIFGRGIWDGAVRPLAIEEILEETAFSWDRGEAAHPAAGKTVPDMERDGAYSWCKAPRLGGEPVETGAFARQVVDGHPLALELAAGGSAGARIVGRLIEIARLVTLIEKWAEALRPGEVFITHGNVPSEGSGVGLTEAARGALGHWVRAEKGRIVSYQIVAPTTWNFSPRDARGVPGPLEQALVGVPEGVMVQHVVRSFDPCMVCTVH